MMGALCINAQSLDELKAMKTDKEAVKKGIDEEIADLEKKILEFPGWTTGVGVLFGLDFAGANRWYGAAGTNPNVSSQKFGIGLNAFANKNEEKYYWRNSIGANWVRGEAITKSDFNSDTDSISTAIQVGTFDLTSLGGYYIYNDLIAVSARANLSTFLFDFTPGSITFSAGVSITPIPNLEFWIHPLGYQLNYPGDDFTSTPGASFGGSYSGNLYRGIKWTSSLAGFFSYSGDDSVTPVVEASELHNWIWTNGFIIDNIFRGIGVGANISLRQNQQLAKAFGIGNADDRSKIQSLYNVGFTYNIAR